MKNKRKKIISYIIYGIVFFILGISIIQTDSLAANKRNISKCNVMNQQWLDCVYDGNIHTPKPSLTYITNGIVINPLKENKDYTCSYKNNIDAGTATIVVKGKGNYKGQKIVKFKINKRDISSATVKFKKKEYVYSGKKIEPIPIVKIGGKEVHNFTRTYKNNKNAGTATIIIKGAKNNKGTIKKTFKIVKRDISKAKVKLSKTEYLYTGKAKTPKPKVTLKGVEIADFTVTYKNNVKVGTATAIIKGKNNNKGTVTKTFRIIDNIYAKIKNQTGSGYSKVVTVGNKKYKVYNQGAFPGRIPGYGCSITSEAIVLSGYGKKKTPTNMANYVGWNFPRSLSQISSDLTKLGVKSKSYAYKSVVTNSNTKKKAIKRIKQNLKKGKPVIILVRGTPYTNDAHYMVITGINSNDKPVIADPNGGKVWTKDTVTKLVNNHIFTSKSGCEYGYVVIEK